MPPPRNIRIELPARESGLYRRQLSARDSAGNVGPATVPRLDCGPARPALRITVQPATDTVWRRALEVSAYLPAGVRMLQRRIYVDSGLPTQELTTVDAQPISITAGVDSMVGLPVTVATPGTHTITVVATGISVAATGARVGRDASARVTRTIAIPDAPYTVTALPALGSDANALGLSARGDGGAGA